MAICLGLVSTGSKSAAVAVDESGKYLGLSSYSAFHWRFMSPRQRSECCRKLVSTLFDRIGYDTDGFSTFRSECKSICIGVGGLDHQAPDVEVRAFLRLIGVLGCRIP